MDLQLENKNDFIRGSSSGIEFATVHSLLREKAHVIINSRNQTRPEKAIRELQLEFPAQKTQGYVTDFSNSVTIEKIVNRLPKIDIIVNNLGVSTS